MQTVASTATVLLVALVNDKQRWSAALTNATNVAHNGQRMILTDKSDVNNTGTDVTATTGVFEQIAPISSTRAVGRLLAGFITTG